MTEADTASDDITLGDLERIANRRDENLRVQRNPVYTKAWFE